MKRIIGISGRKQAGKNTAANYIHGQVLKNLNMIDDFYIDKTGNLVIKTENQVGDSGYGILDITRKDSAYVEYAEKQLWPYIKIYHFADILKELSIILFGLSEKQVYGTNEDKNTITNIKWENVPLNNGKSGFMTSREFLQYFGTVIVRRIYPDAWINSTLNRVIKEDPEIAIIPDVRFPNEIQKIKDNDGIIIRLTRNIYDDKDESETMLDQNNYDWSNFDFIIDNNSGSLDDLLKELNKINLLWI